MLPSVLFKQAVVWGIGVHTGSLLVQGTTKLATKVYKKIKKDETQ